MTAHQITINASNENMGYLIEVLTDKLAELQQQSQQDNKCQFGTVAEFREHRHKAQIDLLQQLIDECKSCYFSDTLREPPEQPQRNA